MLHILVSKTLEMTMAVVKEGTWDPFKNRVIEFQDENKARDYKRLLLKNCLKVTTVRGANMSLRLNYFHPYLEFFRPNLCAYIVRA